jgi:hypothetical protein
MSGIRPVQFEMQAVSIMVFVASRKVTRKCGLTPTRFASSATLSGVVYRSKSPTLDGALPTAMTSKPRPAYQS